MSATVVLKAIGLNVQPNQLDPQSVPPGSLVEASNVIIKRDNVIESRRGYKLYGQPFGTGTDRAKQLAVYKDRILRHFASSLQYDSGLTDASGNEIFNTFSGTYTEPQAGKRIRFIEANSNFYFTTTNGVEKISAKNASQFTTAPGYITDAGGIKALDFTANLDVATGSQTGWFQQDAAVSYRILWNTIDANDNLIQGTPSQRVVVYNPLLNLVLRDFNNLLGALDNISRNSAFPSLINYGQFISTFGLPSNATAPELQSELLALTAELDNNILYADQAAMAPLQIAGASINGDVASIAFTNAGVDPGDYFASGQQINLSGFTPTTGTMNGPHTVASVFNNFSTTGNESSGLPEITQVTTVADVSQSLAGAYWELNSANDVNKYTIWYKVGGAGNDPNLPGRISVMVTCATNDSANTIASNTATALGAYPGDFSVGVASNVLTITNQNVGPAVDASSGTSTFNVVITQQGVANNVLTGVASTTGIFIGALVTGAGIPVNTFVTAVGAFGPGTVTISNGLNVNATGVPLNFGPGITFITSATGSVALSSAKINSYTFTAIAQPGVPNNPPSNQQLVDLQTYLQAIVTALQNESSASSSGNTPTISANSKTLYISSFTLTNSATVLLKITIPQNVTTNDFFQIYRSPQAVASGPAVLQTDVVPSDELQQVYEAYPTATDISNGYIFVQDIDSDAFLGAYLYTNATTGVGILEANEIPPACMDMNYFKNVMFYANTRRRHKISLNLLGVSKMVTDYNNGHTPSILITDGTHVNSYYFVTGLNQVTQVTTTAASTLNGSGNASYFTIYSAQNATSYYVWYKKGTATDPAPLGFNQGIVVPLNGTETANQVATLTADALFVYNYDFTVSVAPPVITITTSGVGYTANSAAGTTPFAVSTPQSGRGENPSTHQVLLSTNISPAIAVNETAQSLVHVINENTNEAVYAYYLSSPTSVPGQMSLEERTLSTTPFYLLANNDNTGLSFQPDLSPDELITNISATNPAVITTASPHGLLNQDQVLIEASNSTPSVDGLYTITYISPTQFSIPINVTVLGTSGSVRAAATAPVSDNEVLINRIYYSQYLQPEGVPLVNTIDVGSKDKAIIRIFPLRDSLFIFKEDGLFRISGEVAPFTLALFDSSVILLPPDSVDVSNNLIFAWTTKGIHTVSEAGVNIISRPIDTIILPLATTQYTNFLSATWGIGYESDNSYTVYTVNNISDVYATVAYRYSTLTNTWTTYKKTDNCGVINPADDKQYLGAGDVNFIEQERKDFTRYDYADREMNIELTKDNFFGTRMVFSDAPTITQYSVLVQNQYVTIYDYNTLLQKMDTDSTLTHTYEANLTLAPGLNIRTAVDSLITQLANDPLRLAQPGATSAATYLAYRTILGTQTITSISPTNPTVITTSSPHGLQNNRQVVISGSNSTPSIDGEYPVTVLSPTTFSIPFNVSGPGTTGSFSVDNENFKDVQASYNAMINTMNNDTGVAFGNYSMVTNVTVQESIITSVQAINNVTQTINVNFNLNYMIGPMIVFDSIPVSVTWAPQTLGDPLGLKHMREMTMMFENKAFTQAAMNFSTDLLPSFNPVPIPGDGNGIFGFTGFGTQMPNSTGGGIGFGGNFFGGGSNSAPFRTYIPRNNQRCRYLTLQFQHNIAREEFAIFGITLTGEISQSTRAYR